MLDQKSMVPLYVQLMEELEKDITSGKYRPGDKIMTEVEMSEAYKVSVVTVRKAVGALMKKGIVVRKQGKGTFVAKPKYSKNMRKLQSFSEMCRQMGVRPGSKTLENCLTEASEDIAKRLGIKTGDRVIYLCRLRYADNEPVVIEKSYFPVRYAYLLDHDFTDKSLFDLLQKQDKKVSGSEKLIELCRATSSEAELLNVKKGDHLLFVRSTAFDQNNDPLYAGVQIINGDRFSLYVYESSEDRCVNM